jgi:hypothetical protein
MSMQGYIYKCNKCKGYHESKHDEIADYICPRTKRQKPLKQGKKPLDDALKYITKLYKKRG